MKHWTRLIALAAMLWVAGHAMANDDVPRDTVYFYDTWEQMLYMTPEAMIVDPYIAAYTPYQVAIETPDDDLNDVIYKSHIAATLGDSIWLINCRYLKREFKGDAKKLSEFAPVFFNDKVAFVAYVGAGDHISLKNVLFGDWVDVDYDEVVDYYYIDFVNRKVRKVTPETLSELLEDYHDLQMRYKGMKDYKKNEIIKDYFMKFVDRATQDVMKPYILDIEGSSFSGLE